jgi:uncharacterized protein YceH (UPF0502 family)
MFTTPEQMAYEAQQAAQLQAHEDAKDAHFRRISNPLVGIVARLEQLETEVAALRGRVAAAELKANRSPDDW